MVSKRAKQDSFSQHSGLLVGLAVDFIILFVLILIVTTMIHNGHISVETMSLLSYLVLFTATLIGTIIGCIISKNGAVWVSACIAGANYALLLSTAILLFDGLSKAALPGLLAILSGAGSGIILLNCVKPSKKHHNKNRRNR